MTLQDSAPLAGVGVAVLLLFLSPSSGAEPKLRPWKALSRLKPPSLLLLSGSMILESSRGRDTFPPKERKWPASLGLWARGKEARQQNSFKGLKPSLQFDILTLLILSFTSVDKRCCVTKKTTVRPVLLWQLELFGLVWETKWFLLQSGVNHHYKVESDSGRI